MKDSDYRIAKWFTQNKRKASVSIYIPEKYTKDHKLMSSPYVMIVNRDEGILIKPFNSIIIEES